MNESTEQSTSKKTPRENIASLSDIALKHYGLENRLTQAQIDMAEMTIAMGHFFQVGEPARSDLEQKLASVIVVTEQLRAAFGPAKIDEQIQIQLRNLKAYIRKDREEAGQEVGVVGATRG